MNGLFRSAPVDPRPLYPHQLQALELIKASLRCGHTRPLIQAPTGFGKTLLAAHIVRGALAKGKRVIFTVPALSLIEQTVAAFEAEGIDSIGVMQGYHWRSDKRQPVQVCSVQTLARREIPQADLVLIDEAHRMFKSVGEWLLNSDWAHVPFVGLSATPWAKGLGKYYDDLIITATTAELIEGGYLSPFVAYAPSTPDLKNVHIVAGEYNQAELSDACNTPELVGDVIDTWLAKGERRQTLCYGVDRAHAEHLQARFLEAEIEAGYVDCFTKSDEREAIFAKFRSGEITVICNVGCLTTGIDLDVRCIIDAHPTRSEMLFVQTIGRGLRAAPGKADCIIFDHAGNHLRLGMVTDIHHDRLDDGKEKKTSIVKPKEKLPKLCKSCKAVMEPAAKVCAQCGAVVETRCDIVMVDGELVRLGSQGAGPKEASDEGKQTFMGELKWLAEEKGYAPGWVSNQFRKKFDHWPNAPVLRHAEQEDPSLRTRQWVKAKAIAYAKARARG